MGLEMVKQKIKARTTFEAFYLALTNCCPSCKKGSVFAGVLSMNKVCNECGWTYARESGFFVGSMIVSYVVGAVCVIPTVILLYFNDADPLWIIAGPCLQLTFMAPLLYRFSRLLWIHMEYRVTQHLS